MCIMQYTMIYKIHIVCTANYESREKITKAQRLYSYKVKSLTPVRFLEIYR